MSKTITRAAAGKDKLKQRCRESESEDSDDVIEVLESKAKLKELKKNRKARREEADAIERKIEEQDAKNAARWKELAKKRNEYPVMLYINSDALYIILC
jgi:hypothetical protein